MAGKSPLLREDAQNSRKGFTVQMLLLPNPSATVSATERKFPSGMIRNLSEAEESNLFNLFEVLNGIDGSREGRDSKLWIPSRDGSFWVSSFYSALSTTSVASRSWLALWKMKAPPRVTAFTWLALRNKILTMDNLRLRHILLVNACPLCLADEESVDHLLFHCKQMRALWSAILYEFNCSWVMSQSIQDLFHQWATPIYTSKGKIMWCLSFLACVWTIWKERNRRCFEGIASSKEDLIFRLKFCIASWVSYLPDFWGLSTDAIMFNWREIISIRFDSLFLSMFLFPLLLGGGYFLGFLLSRFSGYWRASFKNDGCRCCCINFRCEAVFCECFRAGEYCAKGCLNCRNNPANEDIIHDLRQRKESFIPKQELVQLATQSTQNSGGFLMADETTVNGVDSILDPTMNEISKEHPDFEEHDEISALERKIADLEDEKFAIIQENKEQKEKIKLMTLEIDGFKKSKEEMAERLEKMQAEIDRSEDDKKAPKAIAARASELETEVFCMQHDLQSSMSECEDNREKLQKLTGECEALTQSNREKKSKIDDLEKERDFAILQMKKLEAETGKRVQLPQEEVKASVSTKEKLKKAKQDLETLKSSLEEKLKQSEVKLEEMDRIIKDLNKKNELM
ncbi:Reverse transcriptase zinc-binding domain-containing protein [Cinnamomum micranthum f. kanehirae]|uniref:Reverse transcriptase zinc-binding domain-containing protein n=1 Tax=Cinnamomum micranthum f. kanehirae TaxID=337451 RepID=A0A443N980_9MAGN|nr:Reverse transcriptase zinc-binding domain-containing protein [Cinnamomum micranthum f. kanehirae]